MADIDIERRPSSGWLWALLGLVVLALILFWLLRGADTDQVSMTEEPAATEPIPAAPTAPPAVTPTPAALQAYQTRCATPQPAQMALDHQYTSECLRMLVDAVEGTVPGDRLQAVQPQLQNAREAAQRLEASPAEATTHAQTAREGFTAVTGALENVQRQWHPELEGAVRDLSATAESVEPGEQLVQQRDEVQRFFEQAGNVVNRMSSTTTV